MNVIIISCVMMVNILYLLSFSKGKGLVVDVKMLEDKLVELIEDKKRGKKLDITLDKCT